MKKYILAESEVEIKISGTNPQVQFWRDSAKWRVRWIPQSGINVSCWEALSDEMLIRPFPKLISSFSKNNCDSTFEAAAEYSKFEKVQLSYKNSTPSS